MAILCRNMKCCTQSKEYIVDDLLDVMREREVEIYSPDSAFQSAQPSDKKANPILLQMKYSRVIACFAKEQGLSLDAALDSFYHSKVYPLIRDGVSDMHCMSDGYIVEELRGNYE